MTDREMHCLLHLRHTDLVMQNHRVYGASVLPGVVLLEMTLRILAVRGHDPARFALQRILFTEPIVTDPETDREIRVEVRLPADGPGSVAVQSRPWGSDGAFAPSMQALLTVDETPPLPDLDVAARKTACRAGLAMAELYRRARLEEIEHGPKMRCVGQLWIGGGELVAELALEVPGTPGFHMHPAALDASTIAAFGQTQQVSRTPFIPVSIDHFRAVRSLRERFVLHAPRTEVLAPTRDVISNDYDLYDADGRHCASFRKLTCKRIRERELITRLLDRAPAAPAPAPMATPASSPDRPDAVGDARYAELLKTWVAGILGVDPQAVRADVGFFDLGLDSRALLELASRLESVVGTEIYPTLLFEHADITSLDAHLVAAYGPLAGRTPVSRTAGDAGREETAPAPAATILASPDWVIDGRSRLDGSGPRRIAVVGMTEHDVEELRRAAGRDRCVTPCTEDADAVAQTCAERADAVVIFPSGSDREDEGAQLSRVMHWTRAAVGGGRNLDVLVVERGERPSLALEGLAAFLRSVRTETPGVFARALLAPAGTWAAEIIHELERMAEGLPVTAGLLAVEESGRRLVHVLTGDRPADLKRATALPLPRGAVCVVSGGAGGIGRLLANWLSAEIQAEVISLGRSDPDPEVARAWARRPGPGRIEHHRCDVTDLAQLAVVLDQVRRRHGAIHAVFHAAGALADGLHFTADAAQIPTVVAPKVAGFRALDEAMAGDDLRLFVTFSSLASWRPNPGQGVYAFANAVLEGLVARRNGRPDRPGRAVAIAWPLWRQGGMRMTAADLNSAMRLTGLVALPTPVAFDCLKIAAGALPPAARDHGTIAVLHGDAACLRSWLSPEPAPIPAVTASISLEPAPMPAVAGSMSPVAAAPRQPMDIAIVGLAGRYPGASDIDEFWERLCSAYDAITDIPAQRWDHAAIFDPRKGIPGKTYGRWGGFLADIDAFDAGLFNVSRRNAERMDPQERLFLETCWAVLEEAGHPARTLKDRNVGVFVGVMWNHYQLCGGGDVAPTAMHAAIANRVSFTLDLHGPSLAVDTACSSSLTAIGLAIEALRNGSCPLVIAGGVNLSVHPEKYRQLAEGQFLSEDGKCRSFGAGGTGYVPGEGVGAILLRPLADALADGDHIWGIVRSHAMNHAGRTGSFTVPSPTAQAAVIKLALRNGDVAPASIGYVESHGTGTALGDPIEIEALSQALDAHPDRPIPIGSVKSNIGHLEGAAGIAAVSKVLLMLRERMLVPSLHADRLNPALNLDAAGLRVQRQTEAWQSPRGDAPLRAAISAFGAGGSNAHLIMDEGPTAAAPSAADESGQLLVLSTRDRDGLRDYARRMSRALRTRCTARPELESEVLLAIVADLLNVSPTDVRPEDTPRTLGLEAGDLLELRRRAGLRTVPDPDVELRRLVTGTSGRSSIPRLSDVAYTLQMCRTHFDERLAVVVDSLEDAAKLLADFAEGVASERVATGTVRHGTSQEAAAPAARLAEKWVVGAAAGLEGLWLGRRARRVHLPVPALRRDRFWIGVWKAPERAEAACKGSGAGAQPAYAVTMTGSAVSAAVGKEVPPSHGGLSGADTVSESVVATSEPVAFEVLTGGVALVRMQDVSNYNVFTDELLAGLEAAFAAIAARDEIRAVVLTGTDKVFSMGGTPSALERMARKLGSFTDVPFLYEGLPRCRVPVVAAIRGHAVGGGLTFGLHADQVILDRDGLYSANFVKFGFTPGLGATYALERCFGAALAAEMCLTGSGYGGRELESLGARVRFADTEEVLPTALRLASSIAGNAPEVVRAFKADQSAQVLAGQSEVIDREVAMHDRVLNSGLVPRIRALTATATPRVADPAPAPAPEIAPAVAIPAITPVTARKQPDADVAHQIRSTIENALCSHLFVGRHELDSQRTFREMGVDSLGVVEIVRDLNRTFRLDLDSVLVYDHPTIDQLVEAVTTAVGSKAELVTEVLTSEEVPPVEPLPSIVAVSPVALVSPAGAPAEGPRTAEAAGAPGRAAREAIHGPAPLRPAGAERTEEVGGMDGLPPLRLRSATNPQPQASRKTAASPPLSPTIGAPPATERAHAGAAGAPPPAVAATSTPESTSLKGAHSTPSAARVTARPERLQDDEIAIIGMSARYSGARDIDEFWDNLINGRFTVSEVTPDRWDIARYYDSDQHAPGKTTSKWAGLVSDLDRFDATFFGISPREAELMDPQQRVFLEQAWRALEHAGYAVGPARQVDCGVFVGTASGDYLQLLREAGVGDSGQVFIGNSCSILAARIAYFLNLSGPTVALDTACSSSLVALHLACQAILAGDCEMALAGGVALMLTPQMHIWNGKSGMLSPRGRCASFDASADGFALGEGVGAIVVKRLSAALVDRDHIHAVIKASGINGDGKSNGITAPSAVAQERLLERVLGRSGVSVDDLAYIETHGAGTQVGDPIEWKALGALLRGRSCDLPPCGIGSVKSNIGHTTLAAGIAGLLKVVLGLKHHEIPPSLHFDRINPDIDPAAAPLQVVTQRRPWPMGPSGRRVGAVNSFGVSGTNSHAILAEAPAPAAVRPELVDDAYLLPLSAKRPAALREMAEGLRSDLRLGAEIADVAFTLGVGRAMFRKRLAVVATTSDSAIALLSRALDSDALPEVLVEDSAGSPSIVGDRPGRTPPPFDRSLSREDLAALAQAFVAGTDIDFRALYTRRGGRRIPMSGYPLADRRFWVPESDKRVGAAAPPSAAQRRPVPTAPADGVREVTVDLRGDWLQDHRVRGQTLVPGAGAIHHAILAHRSLPVTLSNVEWLRPAHVSEGETLRIRHRIDPAGRCVTELVLGNQDRCAQVVSSPGLDGSEDRPNMERIATGCSEPIGHDRLYREFAAAGIDYGPSYRRVDRILRGNDTAVAWLRQPPGGSQAPIQTIDAILQVTAALELGSELRMPCRAKRVVIRRPVETTTTVAVVRTGEGRYDVTACDAAGALTLAIRGFRLAPAVENRARLYAQRWRKLASMPAGPERSRRTHLRLGAPADVALPGGISGSELVIDVRGAAEEAPEQALHAARKLFVELACRHPDDCRVVLITSGAAAVTDDEPRSPVQSALSGLARSAAAEHPAWRLCVVDLGPGDDVPGSPLPAGGRGVPSLLARRAGSWYERELVPDASADSTATPFRDGLTYLIVGGAGGLGFALSRELAARHRARIGWIGRRPLDARIREQMNLVAELGGMVNYQSADIGDLRPLKDAVRAIRRVLGPISGAVHSAMVLNDVAIANMTDDHLDRVLRPKVSGVRNLHKALEGEPIDRLIFFSSVAALLDSPGQGNYAAASCYLDAYALELRRRYGVPTFVVNWGYWGRIGIVAGGRYQREMAARGVGSIEPGDGFAYLRRQVTMALPQALVLNADPQRFAEYGLKLAGEEPKGVGAEAAAHAVITPAQREADAPTITAAPPPTAHSSGQETAPRPATPDASGPGAAGDGLNTQEVVAYVQKAFARVLKTSADDLDVQQTFESFGVDSLLGMDILRRLKDDLGSLPSTLLYERLTIAEVADYILRHHRDALTSVLLPPAGGQVPGPSTSVDSREAAPDTLARGLVATEPRFGRDVPAPRNGSSLPNQQALPAHDDAIAVVGLAGRYPGASDVEAFWENLRCGQRSLTEMPPDRWGRGLHGDAARKKTGTSNGWGGFIDGVDLFDPQFFGILPSEAAAIDPQERLFLETCWELLEQAGHNGKRSREAATGVFVGVMYGSYGQIAAAEGWPRGEFVLGQSPYWSIANRVSYQFDLTGPSLAVDTACSASLTALHLACESLRRGECRQAIAGGVNVVLHPAHHIALGALNMLGTGPACRTFDATADGMVPGEGVGAVLLRPLADAIADGDEIWAVIRGSMVNAGGKTGGYTVPNPNAQADVIRRALKVAGVTPAAIGCVEVHGTGTQLGDPIEIAALNLVFGGYRRSRPVMVGSLKANIGHLEGAAGIAGITKAVLQLRHSEIAPCAGLGELNPKIDFTAAVQPVLELQAWEPADVDACDVPHRSRTIGVSSFGAGGANAHVIIESWEDQRCPALAHEATAPVFLLSARNLEQLRRYAARVAAWLDRHPGADLLRLCFTSQVGRRQLPVRSATLATSIAQLAEALRRLASATGSAPDASPAIGTATAVSPSAGPAPLLSGDLAELLAQRRLSEIGAAWVRGLAVEWMDLWDGSPGVCSFPTVPLERRPFWLTTSPRPTRGQVPEPDDHWLAALASDHRIQNRRLVPGAALVELLLTGTDTLPLAVRDVRWISPLEVGGPGDLRLEVERHSDRVELRRPGQEPPLAVLTMTSAPPKGPEPADLAALRARCPESLAGETFYARLAGGGFHYGPSLRPVRRLAIGTDLAVAELEVADRGSEHRRAIFVDGAMQVVSELAGGKPALPSGIGVFRQHTPLPERVVAVVERGGDPLTFELRLCSNSGRVLIEIVGLRLALTRDPAARPAVPVAGRTEYLRPVYVPSARQTPAPVPGRVLVVGEDSVQRGEVAEALERRGVGRVTASPHVRASSPVDAVVLLLPDCGDDVTAALQKHLESLRAVALWGKEHRGERAIRLLVAGDAGDPAAKAAAAATRTLGLEHAWLSATHLHLEGPRSEVRAAEIVAELLCATPKEPEVYSDCTGRSVRQLQTFVPEATGELLLRLGGVYVITGGAGALGRLFCQHLLDFGPVTVTLLGRSVPSGELVEWMERRSVSGRRVVYVQVDIAESDALRRAIAGLVAEHGPIRGVLHAAGVQRDGLATRKSDASMAEVLRPKATGVVSLDAATADQPLDFFLVCSSLAGETGNIGQFDYAAANRFLADLAGDRERLRAQGLRKGATVAVEWPLWDDGAMSVDPGTRQLFAQRFGMVPMPTEAGLAALDVALGGKERCFAVVQRPAAVTPEVVSTPGTTTATATAADVRSERPAAHAPSPLERPAAPSALMDADAVEEAVAAELRAIGAGYLLVDPSEIDLDAELSDLGFNSISLTDMVTKVNGRYGLDLLPTVLFEVPTLSGFAAYLAKMHGAQVAKAGRGAPADTPLHQVPAAPVRDEPLSAEAESMPAGSSPAEPLRRDRVPHDWLPAETLAGMPWAAVAGLAVVTPAEETSKGPAPAATRAAVAGDRSTPEPIAIVGIAGRLAGAPSLTEFWDALVNDRPLIGTPGPDREALLADPVIAGVKGGFLADVASFDAAAFGISPREAALMDPQQRLFIESVSEAIQDAGHAPDAWVGRAVGVFAGVSTSDYDTLMVESGVKVEPHMATGIAHSILANRVSHIFDWRGPSEVVDTACSSSLVALHRAVRALRAGECEIALVGGVNVTLAPGLFRAFAEAGMLSPTNACRTFDSKADGYVRGEGVGVVVLRPLSQAIADRDHVYAVVLGSAVNHCGKTTSLTAPNPAAQADVIEQALTDAGADPRSISLIETHGTGTRLGDPIEIEGLKQAYARAFEKRGTPVPSEPWIYLGAVKTAVGHLEAAAGITGLLRTVLSLRHERLIPNRNYSEINPYIRLERSPFKLLTTAVAWRDGTQLRRAGVSSFGFGGTNAHVVLEAAPTVPAAAPSRLEPAFHVFPLSAPSAEQLCRYSAGLADHIAGSKPALADVAYTLQHGRPELSCRVIIVARGQAELLDALRAVAAGERVKHRLVLSATDAAQPSDPVHVQQARRWLRGECVTWPETTGRRAPLPPVPFARSRHWFRTPEVVPVARQKPPPDPLIAVPDKTALGSSSSHPSGTVSAPVRPRMSLTQLPPLENRTVAEASAAPRGDGAPAGGNGATARRGSPRPQGHVRLAPLPKAAPAPPPPTLPVVREAKPVPAAAASSRAVDFIIGRLAAILLLPADKIDCGVRFDDLGLDSIFRVDLVRAVNEHFGLDLKSADLYEVNTAAALGRLVNRLVGTAAAELTAPAAIIAPLDDQFGPARPFKSDRVATICELVVDLTGRRLAADTNFAEGGLTSFDMLRVIARMESELGLLPKVLLFDQPTPRALAVWLERRFGVGVLSGLRVGSKPVPGITGFDRPTEILANGAAVVAKHRLADHPELAAAVEQCEARWAKESGLPGRDIAPLIFLGSHRKGLLNFSERDGILLAWSCAVAEHDFPALAGEWVEWARAHGLRPNLLSMVPLEEVAGMPFCSTLFGTVQRLEEVRHFSLEGAQMRRLRQRVHRFERSGTEKKVDEYLPGSDPVVDARIVKLVDEWAVRKHMVNAYLERVRAEIAQGILTDRNRVFLMSVDGRTMAAVIITKIPSENGYLLDLEFFGDEMADGGLDYTVVEIIRRLAAEGYDMFSFGATLGVIIGESPNPHPAVERTLRDLRESGLFRGDGNFQFKNKFRPRNLPMYLCQPAAASAADVLSLILLITNPTVGQATKRPYGTPAQPVAGATPRTEDAAPRPIAVASGTVVVAPGAGEPTSREVHVAPRVVPASPPPVLQPVPEIVAAHRPRREELRKVGWNPLALPGTSGAFELITDSWAERGEPAISYRIRELGETSMAICRDLSDQTTLPFNYVQAAPSGRAAEAALLRAIGPKRIILQNNLFPSWTFNALDLGFRPVVVRTQAACGDVDLEHLAELLATHRETLELCVIELAPNATGGLPISMQNARKISEVVRAAGIPLVFDATRGLDNACLIAEGRDFWTVARELFSLATAITLSMPKNFGVTSGGLIATNDPVLIRTLRRRVSERGEEVSLNERWLLAAALEDRPWVEDAVRNRVRHTEMVTARLRECGAPVRAAGGHAILLDAARMCGEGFAHPVPSALAWLYETAGVRAAPHLTSGFAPSEGTIRLAIPVGLTDGDVDGLAHELVGAFTSAEQPADLLRLPDEGAGPAFYQLRAPVPEDVAADIGRGSHVRPADQNWAVVTEWQPAARRWLLPHEGGEIEVFEAGDGPPVVFLHPFNIGLGFVAPQLRYLAQRHRVIGIHAPGVGATTAADDLSFPGLARTVLAGVRGIGVAGRFLVAGASFGGLTALSVSHLCPDDVSGLVLLGSSHKVGNRKSDINRLTVVAREDFDALGAAGVKLKTSRDELEGLLLRCESMDPKIGLRYLEQFAGHPDLLADAAKLRVPTLIVHGVHDTVIKLEVARLLHRTIPGARCVEIPDAGHFPSLTSPTEVNAAIASLAKEIEGR